MNGPPEFEHDLGAVKRRLAARARELGFDRCGVAALHLEEDARHLAAWLAAGFHGSMEYMRRHAGLRADPARLVPGSIRAVCLTMNYWPARARPAQAVLDDPARAYVSRYALGRDYHKIVRLALRDLALEFQRDLGSRYRVCVDSAPVLERALARNAGLGWIGKHTNLLARDAGSWFFIGEILTDAPLPPDEPASNHCGSCTACIDVCPTRAIVAPYRLDARRCISYLTIENKGPIPVEFRTALGNRIYGCDDCQLVCPWNRYARAAAHPDFAVRHGLDGAALAGLFAWTAAQFETRMRGSAIYRIGYERWSRNLAVALGNAPSAPEVLAALHGRREGAPGLLAEHIAWALGRHGAAAG
ncbi:MAG TPA: tRNA epoxyqueuosine(34) reductase QueG [Steroidobacteraceae bacterium]|nr:tRNA epoxyqueuosine(34) reductase QueG [Steroidobacteraceae bacterium]